MTYFKADHFMFAPTIDLSICELFLQLYDVRLKVNLRWLSAVSSLEGQPDSFET